MCGSWRIFLLVACASSSHAQERQSVLYGQIYLADRRSPAQAARVVCVQGQSGAKDGGGESFSGGSVSGPDAVGRFTISQIPLAQEVSFWVTHPQFAPHHVIVRQSGKKPNTHLTVYLKHRGGVLEGKVIGAQGNTITGAQVVVFPQAALDDIARKAFLDWIAHEVIGGGEADVPKSLQARTQTDSHGRFYLGHLASGKNIALIQAHGQPFFIRQGLDIAEGQVAQVTFNLNIYSDEPGKRSISVKRKLNRALLDAILRRDTAAVKTLLDKGADPNVRQYYSRTDRPTALMVAAGNGNAEIVKLLLKKGADIYATNGEGITVMWYASESNQIPATGDRARVRQLLKQAGAKE